MLKFIDDILNRITMYRLVLYYLIGLVLAAMALGALGLIPYSPLNIMFSFVFFTLACWIVNTIFAWVFKAPTNVESVYITALILTLIVTPLKSFDVPYVIFMGWICVWAMASKYILAIGKKHIFNPAAFAVALTAFTINQGASWWVGTAWMLPFVLVGGLLVVRKIRRFRLVITYTVVAVATIIAFNLARGTGIITSLDKALVTSPLLFFAFIMITEPLTTPPTKTLQVWYGALVGFLFAPAVHIGSIYSTPELALLAGNVFSYLVSPKQKLLLALKARSKVASATYDFVFDSNKKMNFRPGQYLEWTLGHPSPDNRGNRRYFTIASSPTEKDLIMGVKFYAKGSSYKKALAGMKQDDVIVAAQLAGDFTLPKNKNEKLVFIAGGIVVTPFRSMIKYLIDTGERRDISLFYSNRTADDIAYKDVFDEAHSKLGIKTIYTLTEKNAVPNDWQGKVGYISPDMIAEEVPDFLNRTFYISGPQSMINTFEKALKAMGVKRSQVKKDFFPGFA